MKLEPPLGAVLSSVLIVAAPVRGVAQESASSASLTILAAVDSARAHFPAVPAARERQAAAQAAVGEASSAWYPTLSLKGSATEYQEPMLVTPIHAFRPNELPPFDTTLFQGNLNASWRLFDGGARGARIDAARGDASAAASSFDGTEQDLVQRVVDAYLRVLSDDQILNAQNERIEALEAEHDRTRKLLQAGRAAEVEVLRAEAALSSAEAERVRLAAALDVAERELARVVGTDPERTRAAQLTAVTLADTTPPDRDAILTAARADNPGLERSRAQLATARAQAAVARGGRWPSIDLYGNYNGWADKNGNDALEWNFGAQLAYPLFTGGAITKAIQRTEATSRAASEGLRLTELQLEQDVDAALAMIDQAHARVRSLTTAVQRFEEVTRIEQLSLEAGSGTQTDYLRSEADLLEARAGLAEARHGEMAAHAAVARVAGTLDRAWIARSLEDHR